MSETMSFRSGDTQCVATLHRPPDGAGSAPGVVMGHGFSGTQDQLTVDQAFAATGLAVLTFDYRHFGARGGQPRQVISFSLYQSRG